MISSHRQVINMYFMEWGFRHETPFFDRDFTLVGSLNTESGSCEHNRLRRGSVNICRPIVS